MPNDTYGRKSIVPPLPLSFDRVNEGRFPQSNSLLFKLPFEVLGQILQHVEPASLASLALVNRDCRQLARSRQFASTPLEDACESSFDLMELLRAEGGERDASGTTLSPSLGVCIRRIKISEGRTWANNHLQFNFDDFSFQKTENKERERRLLLKARNFRNKTFFSVAQCILSSRRVLPYLEELEMQCAAAIPQSFFNCLTQPSIQHLKLSSIYVYEDFTIRLLDTVAKSWSLRTLHLEIQPQLGRSEITTAPLCTSILELCAPTLESLTWTDRFPWGNDGYSFATAGLNPTPHFTRLRNLILKNLKFQDSSIFDAIMHDNLCSLGVKIEFDSEYANFFQYHGSIPSLRTFDLLAFGEHTGPTLRFLMANTHLSTLSLQQPISTLFLDTQLLPLLSNSFSKLTSLRLSWEATSISDSALEMISSLNSLQQIHLSGGYPFGRARNFQIDHEATRKHLQKLVFLKKIAFSRDTYNDGLAGSSLEYYYEKEFLAEAAPADSEERDRIWEEKHRKRVLTEANGYAHLMPHLEWLFFGQIPMGFEEQSGIQGRIAIALTTERDSCLTYLRKTFGVLED